MPPDVALEALLDAERVVPCMPGAELDEIVDERTWKATAGIKLGPVGMTFKADVIVEAVDRAANTATLAFRADAGSKGGAQGTVDARIEGDPSGSTVRMDTELKFSGLAARVGRPNIVKGVSKTMVGKFADCLKARLEGGA